MREDEKSRHAMPKSSGFFFLAQVVLTIHSANNPMAVSSYNISDVASDDLGGLRVLWLTLYRTYSCRYNRITYSRRYLFRHYILMILFMSCHVISQLHFHFFMSYSDLSSGSVSLTLVVYICLSIIILKGPHPQQTTSSSRTLLFLLCI